MAHQRKRKLPVNNTNMSLSRVDVYGKKRQGYAVERVHIHGTLENILVLRKSLGIRLETRKMHVRALLHHR